ncbi:MAG: short-chain dehydrogenase, partial [Actinomycetota bacterium]|nr:short-chain dehydrogenase [Actinomycetota bacterium]
AERPKREVIVGNAGRWLALQHSLSLRLYENMAARQIDRDHFQDKPAPSTSGNLFEPVLEGAEVSGGWKHADGTVSARRMALAGTVAAATVGLLGWRRLRRRA